MSWSTQFTTDGAHFVADLDAVSASQVGYAEEESQDQVKAAKAAVASLIGSGAFGDDTYSFAVSISGHANIVHVPTLGWANDYISISITQKEYVGTPSETEPNPPPVTDQSTVPAAPLSPPVQEEVVNPT